MHKHLGKYESFVKDAEDPVQLSEAIFQVVNEKGYYIPLINYDYIKDLIRDEHRAILILKSRQTGFTFGSLVKALVKGILQERYKKIYVSIKKENASEVIQEGLGLLKNMQEPFRVNLTKDSAMSIEIKATRSKIWALSSSTEGGRSYNADVTLDELAFMKNDKQLMKAILQGTVRPRWKTEFISTPFGQTGAFFEMWEKAGWDCNRSWGSPTQEKIFDKYLADFKKNAPTNRSYHVVPWWKCSDLDEEKARELAGSEEAFQEEYCLNFLDGARAVLPHTLLKNNTDYGFTPYNIQTVPVTTNLRFMGLDPADGGNETAACISERVGQEWRTIWLYHEQAEEDAYIPIIQKAFYAFKPRNIFIDNTGQGRSIANRLERMLGSVIERIDLTNQSKQDIIYNLKSAFTNRGLTIPHDEDLHRQLHALRQDRTATGLIKLTGKSPGQDDDLIWALGLSIYPTIINPNFGSYHFESVDIKTNYLSKPQRYEDEGEENILFKQAY